MKRRGLTVLSAVMAALLAWGSSVPPAGITVAMAEAKKKAPPLDPTFAVQKDKMPSANKNAEAVKSLLRTNPDSGPKTRHTGGGAAPGRVR
jgi:hypothetical protein